SSAVYPLVEEPVERFAAIETERFWDFLLEHLLDDAIVDVLALVALAKFTQDTEEGLVAGGCTFCCSLIGLCVLEFGVAQHGSQHVKHPGATAIADCVISA